MYIVFYLFRLMQINLFKGHLGRSSKNVLLDRRRSFGCRVRRQRRLHPSINSKSIKLPFLFFYYYLFAFVEVKVKQGVEYWTSGTDFGCKGKNHWCSIDRKLNNRNLTWSKTEEGDCVSVKYTNTTSTFSKSVCSKRMNFICEV